MARAAAVRGRRARPASCPGGWRRRGRHDSGRDVAGRRSHVLRVGRRADPREAARGLAGPRGRAAGTRREEEPRRYTALHFVFTISGDGVDETKARRAIDLSLEKYCSVVASLAPDMHITYDVALR